MRIAQETGGLSSLLPPNVSSLVDAPFTLYEAILAAIGFNQFSELPDDERPPKSIWLNSEKMGLWWEGVKRQRQLKAEGVETEGSERNALLDLLE